MSASIPISANPSKRPRLATNKRDRFTKLHENMVSNILSRLPTKDVVRTSILSKAWEYKWRSIYNIDIDGDYNIDNEKFTNFMDELFVSIGCLRSVRLLCQLCQTGRCEPPFVAAEEKWFSSFQNWIYASLKHNLEYFEVFQYNEGIVYPSTLLKKTSLRKLILGPSNTRPGTFIMHPSHGTLYVSSVNFAPNLTSMSLGPVTIVNENPICTTVTFNLPTLHTLAFNQCKWLNVKHLEINAPSLTTFTSRFINIYNDDDFDYSMEVISPKLTTFECTSEKIILDGSPVFSASFTVKGMKNPKVRETIASRARNLINKFSSLEKLEISGRIMAKETPLQRHDKLTRLTLRSSDSCACDQLFELLHAMPSLNFLSVHGARMLEYYEDAAIESVPSCISSHLEEVVIQGFCETAREYAFLRYLLNTAKQVKKLTIKGSYSNMEDIKQVLPTFPTCSSTLVVHIVNKDGIPY